MVWQQAVFPLLIVYGSNPGQGFYIYSGVPGPGNPPVAYSAPPGVTHDPYGNTLNFPGPGWSTQVGASYASLSGAVLNLGQTTDATGAQLSAFGGQMVLNAGVSNLVLAEMSAQLIQSNIAGNSPTFNLSSNSSVPAELTFSQGAAGPISVAKPGLTWLPGVDQLQEVLHRDGNAYNMAHFRQAGTGGPQLVNSAADAPVSGLTFPVGIGTYHFHAKVEWTQGGVASNQKFGFTGPAATGKSETITTVTTNSQNVVDARHNSNLATVAVGSATYGATDVLITELDGMATFTAAGTLSVGVACTVAANTFTVTNTESWLDVDPM